MFFLSTLACLRYEVSFCRSGHDAGDFLCVVCRGGGGLAGTVMLGEWGVQITDERPIYIGFIGTEHGLANMKT